MILVVIFLLFATYVESNTISHYDFSSLQNCININDALTNELFESSTQCKILFLKGSYH